MPNLKFCPQCGNKLEINLKFCHNCGFDLSSLSSEPTSAQTEDSLNTSVPHCEPKKDFSDNDEEYIESYVPKIDIQTLGKNFENVIEQIYNSEGYITKKRQKVPGKSGYTNEIDIIAIKKNDKIAIECKNYLSPVGIDKIRDFSEKVRDLGNQWRGVFASFTTFTQDAAEFAKDRHIELLSQEDIKERLYTSLSGRTSLQGDKIYIEDALPVNIDYLEVTDLPLKNKDKITVNSARLIFHPYIVYNYEIKKSYYDRQDQKSRLYKRDGVVIVDLLDNDIIAQDPKKENEIINNKPIRSLSIGIDQNYRVIKLEPNYNRRAFVNIAISFVIEKHTKGEHLPFVLRRNDVILDMGQPIYMPKWDVLFDAFGKIYKREILACSGEEIIDTIASCPYHTKILGSKIFMQSNIAACEECGEAFCNSHGTQCSVCNKWICKDHTITCSICMKPFCKDHIHQSCSYCNDYVCSDCLVTCPTCNQSIGKDHLLICNHCGQPNCEKCMSHEGLLLKKHYCKNKCDLIVKEETDKKGFFGKLVKKI
jgi:hypothetical protein